MKKGLLNGMFALGVCLITMTCSSPAPIQGTISDWEPDEWNDYIYLIDPGSWSRLAASYQGTVLDSFQIDEQGRFALPAGRLPRATEPQVWQLALQPEGSEYLNQLTNEEPDSSNYFPLVYLEGEHIQIEAEAQRFQGSFTIDHPSVANAAMLQLRDIRHLAFKEYLQEKAAANGLLKQEEALLNYQNKLFAFAKQTPQLLPALTAIRWASIDHYYERVPEALFAQAQKWKAKAPNHPWVQELVARADPDQLPLMIGEQIPDAILPILNGDTIAIQNLLAKEITILDLWASWCAPCRIENREVLGPLWEQYHSRGLGILGYALEAERSIWLSAMRNDNADRWPQASHLNGDDSPFFQTLGIRTIPANFLIDQQGRVLAKNLHGTELEDFIVDFFQKKQEY
ncbi:MAG TPA: TlpA disulfide reductase family protein [Saprospiraceae bacterium]|nr:TlpA disulfide reductase family protein [Saprospiraceae bacterium]